MRSNAWTTAEDDYLRNNYEKHTDNELAEALGRSKDSVYMRRRLLGLHRQPSFVQGVRQTCDKPNLTAEDCLNCPFRDCIRATNKMPYSDDAYNREQHAVMRTAHDCTMSTDTMPRVKEVHINAYEG